ncbi:MAG: hypothetical protein H0U03_07095 [Actinobacteria bacterium]|nr:hypothetical protein [Actinomycetota bacterium]
MTRETELRKPRARSLPELDLEQEVDLADVKRRILARWWLPLAGLLLGLAIGYVLGTGSGNTYRAEAIVYLGLPIPPGGGPPIQGLANNPGTVARILRSEAALKEAARASGLRVAKLRGRVSTQTIASGQGARAAAPALFVDVEVKGDAARRIEVAANALARHLARRVSAPYVETRIEQLENRAASQAADLKAIEAQIVTLTAAVRGARRLPPIERIDLVSLLSNSQQRRGDIVDEQAATQQSLVFARTTERATIVEPAVAVETTARSVRNSMLVAGILGLLLGGLAALLWDRFAPRAAGLRGN